MRRLVAVSTIALLLASVIVQFVPFDFQNQIAFAQESGVSVAVELIKKNVVLAVIKNNGETPVYDVYLDGQDSGIIVYIKAEGWARERIDASSIRLSTEDRAIQPGQSMRVLLLVKNIDPTYTLEWTAADANLAIVTKGAMEVNAIMTSLPQDCTAARDQASRLLDELSLDVPDDVERQARDYVARDPQADTVAEAWDNLAAAAMLKGDLPLSAWAGLNSVKAEWSPLHITNAAIYLTNIGKDAEALRMLNCAYDMGYRSAYLFEALATIHDESGDSQKAREYITQAKQLAPNDPIIKVEDALITTGSPPAPEDQDLDRMEILNQAYEELDAHVKETIAQERSELENYINYLQSDPSTDLDDFYIDGAKHRFERIEESLTFQMEEVVYPSLEQAKTEEYFDWSIGGEDEIYRTYTLDAALENMIDTHFQSTGVRLEVSPWEGFAFWPTVLEMDPKEFYADGEWAGGSAQSVDTDFYGDTLVDSAANEIRKAREEIEKSGIWTPYVDPFPTRNPIYDPTYCGDIPSKYQAYVEQRNHRYSLAEKNFEKTARAYLASKEVEFIKARDYAQKYIDLMIDPTTLALDFLQERYDSFITRVAPDSVSYMRIQQIYFEVQPKNLERQERFYDLYPHNPNGDNCATGEKAKSFKTMTEEEYQAYLAELLQRMAEDIDSDATANLDCEVSVGPFSLSSNLRERKASVSWDWGAGDTPLDHEPSVTLNPDRTVSIVIEPDIKRSVEVGASSGGVAVEGGITVTKKFDEVRIYGKGGFGADLGEVAATCHIVEVGSTIKVRSVLEAALEYLEADARRN